MNEIEDIMENEDQATCTEAAFDDKAPPPITPKTPHRDEGDITDATADEGSADQAAEGSLADSAAAPSEANQPKRSVTEIIMEDLDELIADFPELASLRDIEELNDPLRYGRLRDLGLTPKEAYLATRGKKVTQDSRAHLSGAKPKPMNTPGSISSYAVRCVRELFDGISDEEIISLYKRVNG